MNRNNLPQDELSEHIVNALERRGEQSALEELRSVNESELRRTISRTRQHYKLSARPSSWRMIAAIGSAAAVIALLWVGFQPKYSTAELYQSYGPIAAYEPAPPGRGESVVESDDDKIYASALELIGNNKIGEAIGKLTYLAERTSFEFHQRVKWELALAYLHIDNRVEASKLLEEISKDNGEYNSAASELLAKLNKKRWF